MRLYAINIKGVAGKEKFWDNNGLKNRKQTVLYIAALMT